MGSLLGNHADTSCHSIIYLKIKIDPQQLFFSRHQKETFSVHYNIIR